MSLKWLKPLRGGRSRERRPLSHGMRGGESWGLAVVVLAFAAGLAPVVWGAFSASARAQGVFASGVHSSAAHAAQHQRFAFRFPQQGGAALYHDICQGCHMPDAKGACGAGCYPALAGDPALIVPDFAVTTVVNGREGMPAFGRMLTDRQIADVINYIRTHFGNHYPAAVTPAQVKAARHGAGATRAPP
ncbi:MAG: c-type cytochrome [Steroidobacteraceae bacterium]